MRYGITFPHPVVRKETTNGGLLRISSVHEHEQIADGRSERNMTLAYWVRSEYLELRKTH